MFRSILVPLDGSRFAELALPFAVALAGRAKARLRLLAVHEPRADIFPGLDVPAIDAENVEIRSATLTYLAETAQRLGQVGGGPVATEVVDGIAGPGLVDAVQRLAPDLVVMCTHGRGPMSRFWLGSVADHFLRHANTPLLLVRPHAGEPAPEPRLERMLVALDLSEHSAAILEPAANLAAAWKAELRLFHVVEPMVGIVDGALPFPIPVDASALESRRADAAKRLAELAEPLQARGLKVSTEVIVGVGAPQTVLEEAATYDLVAMTTHGEGGFRRLLVGSVADKVIRGSEHPVLVVRGSEARA